MFRVAAVGALTLLPTRLPVAAQETPPDTTALAREISAVRAASNVAFAAGDVAGMLAAIDVDYVGTGGSGGHIRSREELVVLFRRIAESPVGLHFIRTPGRIEVSPDGLRAMETGRWVGRERRDGVQVTTVGGGYTAYWRRVDDRWVIHAEVFVTLHPAGTTSRIPG